MTTFPSVRAVSKAAGYGRVRMNGLDITGFRAETMNDHPIKVPAFDLIEPFGYGASDPLVISRTNCNFEEYGQGDLAFLHKGARVEYVRVLNGGTIDEEVIVDYVGVVTAVDTSSREWVAQIAGSVLGRASAIWKPKVKFRKLYDLGSMVGFAADTMGLHMYPRGGPDTGINYPNQGGLWMDAWLSRLGPLSRTGSSPMRCFMPGVWGGDTWTFEPKDLDTIHATAFSEGRRIRLDLTDDVLEQPNTIYGSGISPDGERWDGGVYPRLFQGTPAPYPFNDDRDFGIGTTDADTDTGDSISVVLRDRLVRCSFLSPEHSDGDTYDIYVARAVNHLKDKAGLTQDGVMTPAAWSALWDVGVVALSGEGARVMPLVQAARIRNYNYSSTGNPMGRNPLHQKGAFRVDRVLEYGVMEEADARHNASDLVHDTEGHQWAGTITFSTAAAAFSGERDAAYADAVAADPSAFVDDLMSAKDIRPGMNVWLPYFDGGTLVHVAGANVNGSTVTLTVDTAGRDAFDIIEALDRNRESRRDVAREWRAENRPNRPSNNFIMRDKFFGKLYQDVPLRGGHWNVIPIVMGQTGTVNEVDIRLTDTATEFCFAVFAKEMFADSMDGLIGNPFNLDDDDLTVWEHQSMQEFFEQRLLLTVQGQGSQPCGYSWMEGYKDEEGTRTANPLTGTVLDRDPWAYYCDPDGAPVVYLCIYPRDDCTLKRGALFAALEDDAT